MSAARQLLDQAHSLPRLDALAADADAYANALALEVSGPVATLQELEQRDAALAAALAHIDATIGRAMRIRLDHALATDTAIGGPTRKVFASTVVAYANDLVLLEQRAREIAGRGRAADPDAVASAVVDAARAVLALRDALRAGVLALIRDLATAAVPHADRRARDRQLDEVQRRRWSAARRDLEASAADPAQIASAPMAARLAALPEQLDEPAAEPEVSFADMIELD